MKNRLLPLFVVLGAYSAYSQVGVGTLSPKSSAQLEVFSNNKGMLIPQIALTSTTDTQTIVNGNIVSLLVYNTTDNANITPGYYYWFDNRWNRMLISGDLTAIAGNSVPGAKGEPGYPGKNVTIYTDKTTSIVYVQNSDGTWSPINGSSGIPGKDGKSAFEIWAELPENNGKTVIEYLASLKGDTGADGKSAFEIWKELPGNDGKDMNEYIAGLKGATGATGPQGIAGIGGKTNAGTNVTISGAGTDVSPYVVNAVVPQQAIDEFTAIAGQTSFTLASAPSSLSKVKLYINGVRIDKDAISVSGNVLTYNSGNNGSYILMTSDNVTIDYLK